MDRKLKNIVFMFLMTLVFNASPLFAEFQQNTSSGVTWLIQNKLGNEYWGRRIPANVEIDELTNDDLSPVAFRDSTQAAATLAIYDQNSSDYKNVLTWLQSANVKTTEYISEKISILAAAGKDVPVDLATLLSYQSKNGGFGGYKNTPSNSLDTAFALQALKAANYSDTNVLYQAINFLTASQNTDGGWGFRPATSAVPGDPSNTYVTAIVSSTLQLFPQTTTLASAISKATSFLLAHQNPDGGFGSSPSNVYETALAFKALFGVTTDATILGKAVSYLTTTQSADGSWNQDPYSTALALQALYLSETRPPVPPPAPTTGTVNGTVVDAASNQPLSGVRAVLVSNSSLTALTNSTGSFSLADVPQGSQQITFSISGYETATASVAVTAGSIINLGVIPLIVVPTTGIVQGAVTDASTGGALPGVTITIAGASAWTAVTATDGSYRIPDIAPGSVTITASKAGYYSVSAAGTVAAGGTLVFSPALSTVPPTVTTGELKGRVADSSTGLPVQGATIAITPAPAGIGPATSSASGSFSISGIAPGTYTVSIAATGYAGQVYNATIVAGAATDLGTIALAPTPSATTITGIVKDASTGNPIAGAEVAIIGTNFAATTDATGAYTLSGVPLLEFNLKASSAGYDSLMFIMSTAAFGTYTVNFPLTPSRASDLRIVSLLTDKQSYPAYAPVAVTAEVQNTGAQPVSGSVSVSIENAQGQVVDYLQATTVDANGAVQSSFVFQPGITTSITVPWETKDLPPGTYALFAKVMTGEAGAGGGAAVAAEGATHFNIDQTQAIAELVVTPLPKYTNLGATEQISLQATLANRSNVAMELGIAYEWRSPAGLVLRSGAGTISLLPAESSKAVTLDSFPFTFTESGAHPVFVSIVSGPTPASVTGGVISVAPAVRIEPSQSIAPPTVVPDGDKRIRMQIRLKGVEQR